VSPQEISFFTEDISFTLRNKNKLRKWIQVVIGNEKKLPGNLNYIFCSDDYLYKLNKQYLNHDTLTDIITFDLSEKPDEISGEIYISIDRVKENAKKFKVTFYNELHRVMIHGILHLAGYHDKTQEEIIQMRSKEDKCLSLLPEILG
jgi:rRNA maturation RNase YbeY